MGGPFRTSLEMKIIQYIIIFIICIGIVRAETGDDPNEINRDESDENSKTEKEENGPMSCPTVYSMSMGQETKFSWNRTCEYCVIRSYRKSMKDHFQLDVECKLPGSNKTSQLKPDHCKYGLIASGEHGSTICRVDKNEKLTQHGIWNTYFSTQPTEWKAGIIAMNEIAHHSVEHDHDHRHAHGHGTEVSYLNLGLLIGIYMIFGVLNIIQFAFNEEGVWY